MIHKIVISVIVAVLAVVGLSFYLQPDDLAKCNKKPGGSNDCQVVDAIVAISGGDTTARANQAIDLYKNGWSHLLFFSGAAQDKTGPSNAAVMKQLAIKAGVPENSIYIDENAETTQQNAAKTQATFNDMGIKKIILVTSGYHQRRASLEFNKLTSGMTILNHPVASDQDWSFWWWVTPRGWSLAGSEIVKIVIFYMFGV